MTKSTSIICAILFIGVIFFVVSYFISSSNQKKYTTIKNTASVESNTVQLPVQPVALPVPMPTPVLSDPEDTVVVTHVSTPSPLKAIYLSSWIAGSKKNRQRIFNILDSTEINAVVIDVKDYTGHISYAVSDPYLKEIGSAEKRITDIKQFIDQLHKKNIYVIGRITVFQDPYLITKLPLSAIKTKSDPTKNWLDSKGIGWLDAGSTDVYKYVVAIARDAYSVGFDEANFDYMRFPSDGNLKDAYYTFQNGRTRAQVMTSFFEYIKNELGGTGIITSADIFGLSTTDPGDVGIGQHFENVVLNFDYVSPMVYPSHFAHGEYGIQNPATKPYEVISYAMKKAVERVQALGLDPKVLRPWLQDFDLGAVYTKDMVQSEIKAIYDVGLDSWMMWDPSNRYKSDAFLPDGATEKTPDTTTDAPVVVPESETPPVQELQ